MHAVDPQKYGINLKLATQVVDSEELLVTPLPPFSEFAQQHGKVFEEWPEWYLKTFIPAIETPAAREYLHGREVSDELMSKFDLRFDPGRSMICTPFRDVMGKLAGVRGRSIDPGAPKWRRHYDYTYNGVNNTSLTWFNEQALQLECPIIVVEGQFDAMHVWQVYEGVVGGLGAQATEYKLKMLQFAQSVLFMRDNDEAGVKSTAKDREWLESRGVKCGEVEYPSEWNDPDKVPLEWLRQVLKDVGPVK